MSIGNPQSFNRYGYVGNEPTNFIDPSGLATCYGYHVFILHFENGNLVSVDYLGFISLFCVSDGPFGVDNGGPGGGGGGHGSAGAGSSPGQSDKAADRDKKKKCEQDPNGENNRKSIEDYLTKAGLLDKANPDKSLIKPGSIEVSREGIVFTINNLNAFNAALSSSPFAVDLNVGFPWNGQHDGQVNGPGVDNRFRTGTKPDKLGPQSLQLVTGPANDQGGARGYADLDCSNPAQSFWQAIQHILGR